MPKLKDICKKQRVKLQQELSNKEKKIAMLVKEVISVNDYFKKELKENCKECVVFDYYRNICSDLPEDACELRQKILYLDKLTGVVK